MKIRDQKRKHRFEKDVLVNYMAWKWTTLRARFCQLSQKVAKCVCATDNPSPALVKAVSRTCYSSATDILSRRFFFAIVQKLLKQLARLQSGQE